MFSDEINKMLRLAVGLIKRGEVEMAHSIVDAIVGLRRVEMIESIISIFNEEEE